MAEKKEIKPRKLKLVELRGKVKTKKAEKKPVAPIKKEHYFEAVGRRKTAIARVRLYTKKTGLEVNNQDFQKYFPISRLQKKTTAALEKMKITDKLGAVVKVKGGGFNAQAEAIALGIARALVKFNPDFRKRLRRFGFLTRDSRAVERKKYGLKKARRAPQWKKR
jgi:small subunit ribosomal protein S9